ncbi:cation:proton antiporter subunit C [Maricaulis salignorans]|uniref:Multisubunit sodium/proton antiporter, MrpC subunit n=1 Tax=Maricaulis salignorans TaxID=144026 RepID=A0A1G9Q5X2_9PROT|nr:cation:proton antiporter subunit C [Maricaulis salignorans]SDM06323.1 multisubunit sodium/proton antiporter, MrpC subunit [Maricaulis salignorans]
MLDILLERFNYIPIIILMMTGLYVVFATGNLVKRLVGLSLFQTSVFLLYITLAKVFGGQPPIIADAHGDDHGAAAAGHGAAEAVLYSNPLPHVLILTAIVVGVATLAVGLALVVRIREAYGSIEDEALNAADYSRDTGAAG